MAAADYRLMTDETGKRIAAALESIDEHEELVTGVKGNSETTYRKGNVNITKANIGLGSVDNTADADKRDAVAEHPAHVRHCGGIKAGHIQTRQVVAVPEHVAHVRHRGSVESGGIGDLHHI